MRGETAATALRLGGSGGERGEAGGHHLKSRRRFPGDGPFSALKRKAEAGDRWARERLRWHVQRRQAQGWRMKTIAKRLQMEVFEVEQLAERRRPLPFDPTPRLVRRSEYR